MFICPRVYFKRVARFAFCLDVNIIKWIIIKMLKSNGSEIEIENQSNDGIVLREISCMIQKSL